MKRSFSSCLLSLVLYLISTLPGGSQSNYRIDSYVIGSAGGSIDAAAGAVAFTVGEPVIATLSPDGARALTQGFHQPVWRIEAGYLAPPPRKGGGEARLFPNPVSDRLILDLSGLDGPAFFDLQIIDMTGRPVSPGQRVEAGDRVSLSCQSLPAGAYLLRIRAVAGNRETILSFIKTN